MCCSITKSEIRRLAGGLAVSGQVRERDSPKMTIRQTKGRAHSGVLNYIVIRFESRRSCNHRHIAL